MEIGHVIEGDYSSTIEAREGFLGDDWSATVVEVKFVNETVELSGELAKPFEGESAYDAISKAEDAFRKWAKSQPRKRLSDIPGIKKPQ